MAGRGRIDAWKVQEVLRYLEKAFPAARLEDYPRGDAAAHLFVVTEAATDPRRQQRHHLVIARQFFDRCSDPTTLKDALEAAHVARSLSRVGDRTVELY